LDTRASAQRGSVIGRFIEGPQMTSAGEHVVLVIDDDTEVRRLMRKLLERWGYRVLDTGSNDEALDILERDAAGIALIIQDCARPLGRCLNPEDNEQAKRTVVDESGILFYDKILRPLFAQIPVLFCTGFPIQEIAFPVEADGYLPKPIWPIHLRITVEKILMAHKVHPEETRG
jgi:CheY-like chemotaxis protein